MDLLTGFAAVVGVVLAGVLLGHLKLVDDAGRRTLNDVSFFAASPALMLLVISDVEMDADLAANVATAVVSPGLAVSVYQVMTTRCSIALGLSAEGKMMQNTSPSREES